MAYRLLGALSLRLAPLHNYAICQKRALSSNTAKQVTNHGQLSITFKEYRSIRKRMKWRDMGVGLLGGVLSMYGFIEMFIHNYPDLFTMSPEEIKPIFGLDPLIVLGIGGMGSFLIGYLIVNHGNSAVWRLIRPELSKQLSQRDRDFMQRVAAYRFKGTTQQWWEDDYHGDKINTVSDYRQWIRKQQQKAREEQKFT